MTDFLITELSLYPWFTWLVVLFTGAGIGYSAVWLYRVQAAGYAWLGYRRQVWRSKAAVRRQLLDDPLRDCAECRERDAMVMEALIEDDPPEYQHPDGDDELLAWEADEAADERWGQDMADLAEVLRVAHERGLLDDEWETDLRRCDNPDCGLVGMLHNGPCDVPEEEVKVESLDAEFAEAGGYGPYRDGAAMPPQPVREYLHPAIQEHLKAAGFSEHETNEGAVESSFTRAQAAEVQAMMRELER